MKTKIESLLRTQWAGRNLFCYEETDSTNILAKAGGEAGDPHGTLYVAEKQNAGRGRRGRVWESPAKSSIYMTILLRPETAPVKAPMLTLVMAAAVADGIKKTVGNAAAESSDAENVSRTGEPGIQIKWPNDIVLNRRKLCGILTEMSAETDHINYVMIGVGVNVNQDAFPEELKEKATSLKIETGEEWNRPEIIASIMESFEHYYKIFLETEDLSGIQDEYNQMLANRDRDVRILEPGGDYDAHAEGINEVGELIVTTPDGQKKHIFAGEVSVRGIYGYV